MPTIAAVATLLSQVFGWIVPPEGLSAMKLEHQLHLLSAGIHVAIDKKDYAAIDMLFTQYRLLSKSIAP